MTLDINIFLKYLNYVINKKYNIFSRCRETGGVTALVVIRGLALNQLDLSNTNTNVGDLIMRVP